MKVLIFGQLVDCVGSEKIDINEIKSTLSLKEYLLKTYPSLEGKTFLIAVNNAVIEGEHKINNQDEIALLPPYSGG